jgi:hypothetical protein
VGWGRGHENPHQASEDVVVGGEGLGGEASRSSHRGREAAAAACDRAATEDRVGAPEKEP